MILWDTLTCVTAQEMARIDQAAILTYHLPLLAMMENAGRSLALLIKQSTGDIRGKPIICLIGKGHNGGGGLVAARHLANWGADPHLVLAEPVEKLRPTTAHQFQIVDAMGIPSANSYPQIHPVIIIDALLGYQGQGNPRGSIARLIRKTKDSAARIIALDIPSGLDATTGDPNKPCIKAQATLTLALPKTGLMTSQSKPYVGELYLADIGIPRKVLKEVLKCDELVYAPSPKIIRLQETVKEH